MTKSEVKKFRKVLEANLTELGGSTRRRDAILIDGSGDEIDRVLRAAEREIAVRSLEAVSVKLREARSALRRIKEGAYGICAECEEAISPARLAALPWAALCIRCQQAMDCDCGAKNAGPSFARAA